MSKLVGCECGVLSWSEVVPIGACVLSEQGGVIGACRCYQSEWVLDRVRIAAIVTERG